MKEIKKPTFGDLVHTFGNSLLEPDFIFVSNFDASLVQSADIMQVYVMSSLNNVECHNL